MEYPLPSFGKASIQTKQTNKQALQSFNIKRPSLLLWKDLKNNVDNVVLPSFFMNFLSDFQGEGSKTDSLSKAFFHRIQGPR